MARPKKSRFEPGSFAPVVFHSPTQQQVSPAVIHHWERPVAELLLKSEAPFTTNDVHLICARFIGWCYKQPDIDTFVFGVYNVPVRAG
ncbi:hypothetical protein, partial [Enterococcus faecium]